MARRERFELPRFAPAVFETAAIPGLATSAATPPSCSCFKVLSWNGPFTDMFVGIEPVDVSDGLRMPPPRLNIIHP